MFIESVYHGTNIDNLKELKIEFVGSAGDNWGHYGYGIYGTEDRWYAEEYGPHVYRFQADLKNPFIASSKKHRDMLLKNPRLREEFPILTKIIIDRMSPFAYTQSSLIEELKKSGKLNSAEMLEKLRKDNCYLRYSSRQGIITVVCDNNPDQSERLTKVFQENIPLIAKQMPRDSIYSFINYVMLSDRLYHKPWRERTIYNPKTYGISDFFDRDLIEQGLNPEILWRKNTNIPKRELELWDSTELLAIISKGGSKSNTIKLTKILKEMGFDSVYHTGMEIVLFYPDTQIKNLYKVT